MSQSKRKWVVVRGYNRQVSGNIPAATSDPLRVFTDVPSNELTLRVTHMATYAGSLAAFNYCTWLSPFFPYDQQKDQMGEQGKPLELKDTPELSPGQTLWLSGLNTDPANAYGIGWVIQGELGYYE